MTRKLLSFLILMVLLLTGCQIKDGDKVIDENKIVEEKNIIPVANAGLDRRVIVEQSNEFSAVESYDQDGEIISYHWDLGDGNSQNGEKINHIFGTSGTFIVTLTVTDDEGVTATDTTEVTVIETEKSVYVEGRQIIAGDVPFYIKGVCWSPVGIGGTVPFDLDFSGYVELDAPLMAAAGINVIRTYQPFVDREAMDILYDNGIFIINTVYDWGGNDPDVVIDMVNQLKDHPAILMWCIGNEWNDNGIYVGLNMTESIDRINEVASLIKSVDTTHPITTVYATTPSEDTINSMPDIDIWGLNYYLELGFEFPAIGNVFDDWNTRSTKPMFIAEYGADAWNANIPGIDLDSQAEATRVLTQIILDNSVVVYPDKICSGGSIFEWCDEWWKVDEYFGGSLTIQDVGGLSNPVDGPYPDRIYNEEYWGIVDIDRNLRPAYYELQTLYNADN